MPELRTVRLSSGCRDRPLSRSRCLLVVPARTCGTVCRCDRLRSHCRQNAGSCEWLRGCRDRPSACESATEARIRVPSAPTDMQPLRLLALAATPALVSGSEGAETARRLLVSRWLSRSRATGAAASASAAATSASGSDGTQMQARATAAAASDCSGCMSIGSDGTRMHARCLLL